MVGMGVRDGMAAGGGGTIGSEAVGPRASCVNSATTVCAAWVSIVGFSSVGDGVAVVPQAFKNSIIDRDRQRAG